MNYCDVRRAIGLLLLIGMFVVPLTARRAAAADEKEPRRPNIVLLISDDDDYEHFGFMGSKIAHTPTLDMLAKAGTVFTTAHCPAPVCRPSLAAILSGKLPLQTGIYGNCMEIAGIGLDHTKLDPRGSLANRLKDAGYATYATGKYWEGDARAMGFTDGTVDVTIKGFGKFVRQNQDELFHFIDAKHGKQPMFIWWAPLLPHEPHNPPPRFSKLFAKTEIPIPSFYHGDRAKYVDAQRRFYGNGTWFDEGVAALIKKLKDVGEFDNTMFFFYVDNGFAIGMPAKDSPTEKGMRTPLIIYGPGRVPAGKRIDGLTYAIDLHATMLDYAGITPPKDIESKTLRPLIEGKTDKTEDTLFGTVFANYAAYYKGKVPRSPARDLIAIYARTPKWKYVLFAQDVSKKNERYAYTIHVLAPMPNWRQGQEMLFDLSTDPYEEHDLSKQSEQKQRLADFHRQVIDWWHKTGGGPLAKKVEGMAKE